MKKIAFYIFKCFVPVVFLFGGCVFFSASFGEDESIDQIEFRVNEEASLPQVSATVYFVGQKERKKLSSGDQVMINGKAMSGESYNNGTASGYKYTLELDKANVYELKVMHGGKETKQQVHPQIFSTSLPSSISVNKDLEIPFTLGSDTSGKSYIEISSISKKDPILTTDKYKRAFRLSSYESGNKLVIAQNQLKDLKFGRAELSVARIFGESYVVSYKKEIEITK